MKKLIALLLVLAMVFAFAGCESAEKTKEKTEKTNEATPDTTESDAEQISLSDALDNTVKALEAGNLTITIDGGAEVTEETIPGLVAGYYSPINGQLQIIVDPEEKDLTVYGKVMSDSEIQTVVVYDGWSVSGGYYMDGWYKEDISEDLEMLFTETDSGSLEELLGELTEEDLEMIGEIIDLEKLIELLKTLVTEKFADEQWIKDNFGYTVTTESGTTVHTFDLDIMAIVKMLLGHIEEAFVNPEDYEELMELLDESLADLEDLDIKLKMIQTGDMITGFALEFEGEVDGEYGKVEFTVAISEIGTTTIDTEKLAKIIEELPDYEEYYEEKYGDYEDYYDDIIYEDTETGSEL